MTDTTLSCAVCNDKGMHLHGVLIDQGGAITRIDGSGTRLIRGRDLDYVRKHLPRHDRGSTVHTVYCCEECDGPFGPSTELVVMSDTFAKGEVTRRWTALSDCPLHLKELWRD